ncbi:Adaptor protein complex AP-2 alpha subunit [Polychaeton citri CBS 116435]|uniref:AP-2 complex subunit alpha n=1 Tax=Polychaeton citri CBS 116435 TaxID=1314669 RepID=A0A9P4QGZ1_9PEZI|nr:Adaptor protein complex AP-2 alpha subunit [Polychaeton citri CBS 116435]
MAAAAAGLFNRGIGGSGSSKDGTMRGLVSFIADLRNARARELEEKRINKELANIRGKFKQGNLTGYDKKKYVCKLLYIYILGWNVDFGHLEAVNLISATKYSEKQIGYLAVTLFLHEQHELIHLVVNSIRKDLSDHNELNNCLALHAIANVGGREMSEALASDVHRLLISPTSKPFVKKKAALTLLRLYRKVPSIVQPEWSERIVAIMDDPDMGVALSVTSLVTALAQDNPDSYKGSYVKATQRLKKIVVDQEYSGDYVYYKVPCPWLQVKLLRLLQYFPPSTDSHVRSILREALRAILENAMDTPKNVQQNNAQNSVLFEAINLIIHLDTEQDLKIQISSKLGKFISSRETNVRYLGLEAMTHLAVSSETLEPIKKHQDLIIGSLKDRDITVRRQGLDLLYSMCDSSNAVKIVHELLRYLQTADYAIREEMVLKIAILTEKYATDVKWYVDISMRLIAMAGDHVSDEVWQRIVQIVTNNEELQVYAAQNILQYCKADHCHETLVKIGSYILGEFGHLIADNKGCSPIEQFMALQAKFGGCSLNTRAMILSAFVKFINLFPEIKPQLLQAFRLYSHSLDSELQQRACEYLALATLPNDDLLRTVCDEMPPFPERASALLSRLDKKQVVGGDRRVWSVTSKDGLPNAPERTGTLKRNFSNPAAAALNGVMTNGTNGTTNGTNATNAPLKSPTEELAGLDLLSGGPNLASASHLSPGWERGYNRLVLQSEGILYEDGQLEVGLRSEYRQEVGCLIIYFANKSTAAIQSFTTTLDNSRSAAHLIPDIKSLPDTTVHAGQQTQQMITFEAKSIFNDPPTIRISYIAGALQAITLQLPVLPHKYMDSAMLNADDFFKRWKQIGGAPREAQKIFQGANGRVGSNEETRRVLTGMKWGILDGVDSNGRNFVAATILHTSSGKIGCLMRLEPNTANGMYRLTIRATDESVPPVLLKAMDERLTKPYPI